MEEIGALRRHGVHVIPCSARRVHPKSDGGLKLFASETLYLQPLRLKLLLRAAWLGLRKFHLLADFLMRALAQGNESPARRVRALLHTWLGVYYALLLEERDVQHIHVHHGYFASWIAMVAARVLDISFSFTLHGSDLLLHGVYLDTKLKNCKFCLTVSEYNRQYILEHYPEVSPSKLMVQRLGVLAPQPFLANPAERKGPCLILLAVGRLHPVKDHAFLIQACRRLNDRGTNFLCLIAGEGPERLRLESLIRELNLGPQIVLLGHVSRPQLDFYYAIADAVVLTSRSEGVPLALMEAMAHGRTVLAPSITGIPELVQDGQTGFLYRAGSLEDFVRKVEAIRDSPSTLEPLHRAARRHVLEHYNREKNLAAFADTFLACVSAPEESHFHEDPVLQQI